MIEVYFSLIFVALMSYGMALFQTFEQPQYNLTLHQAAGVVAFAAYYSTLIPQRLSKINVCSL